MYIICYNKYSSAEIPKLIDQFLLAARIVRLTGINLNAKSHVLVYAAVLRTHPDYTFSLFYFYLLLLKSSVLHGNLAIVLAVVKPSRAPNDKKNTQKNIY